MASTGFSSRPRGRSMADDPYVFLFARRINNAAPGRATGDPGEILQGTKSPAALVRAGGPDTIAAFAIRPDLADIGGTGGRPPGREQDGDRGRASGMAR